MSLTDLTAQGLGRALNAVIRLDPVAADRLAALQGKLIRIELTGTPVTLDIVPQVDGSLEVLGQTEDEPDAILSGSPFDLLRARDPSAGVAELFAGRVSISGDTGLAQTFSQALAGLDIDWEELLAQLIGDIPAHELGRAARAARDTSQRLQASSEETLSEYLTEESRVLPHRFEVDDFLVEVDTLRDDVERLAARITRLEKPDDGEDA